MGGPPPPRSHMGSRAKATLRPEESQGRSLSSGRQKPSTLGTSHKTAVGGMNSSCSGSPLGKLSGCPTMAPKGLSSWEQQVCAPGVGVTASTPD